MPTLIRLFIVLVVLAGLVFAGMIALTIMVDPGEKDITIKIPARELVPPSAPIDLDNLPAPVNVAPKDESSAVSSSLPSIDISDSEADESGVKTVDTGAE
ncbi:MAG: hypothetical protein BGO82_01005 [Devosia sp. 67-54]|uniref:hypothetical protein n=1 Tax=unclassified Devosia TaxID=196773 RepID=UPI0009641F7B|nr:MULTISPECIES: hypothetical protein [unclassified Devosia]MBN9305957.1 hypothetical protein [Devosia sp.]OJX16355.1 MAG: hypothetical protein BGO82_01005 [Devosia sp. 67-54]